MEIKKIEISRIWYHGELPVEDGFGLDEPYPPIIVGPADGDGEHELVDGYHRLAAATNDGRRRIRAIIVSPEEHRLMETMPEEAWIEWVQAQAEEM